MVNRDPRRDLSQICDTKSTIPLVWTQSSSREGRTYLNRWKPLQTNKVSCTTHFRAKTVTTRANKDTALPTLWRTERWSRLLLSQGNRPRACLRLVPNQSKSLDPARGSAKTQGCRGKTLLLDYLQSDLAKSFSRRHLCPSGLSQEVKTACPRNDPRAIRACVQNQAIQHLVAIIQTLRVIHQMWWSENREEWQSIWSTRDATQALRNQWILTR